MECLQSLLDLGVIDINQKDANGNSVLHLAVLNEEISTNGGLHFVVRLTANGADLTAKNNDGLTAQDITSIFLGEKEAVGAVGRRYGDLDHIHLLNNYLKNAL